MITEAHKEHIRRTWKLVIPIGETAADLFYRRLFELKPEYRALFPEDLQGQKGKLLRMLAFIVKALDFPESAWRETVPESEDLMLVLLALGRRHKDLYKVPRESYDTVGEALLWTLDYGLGEAFSPEVKDAWTAVYKTVATAMILSSTAVAPERGVVDALAAGQAALDESMRQMGVDEVKTTDGQSGAYTGRAQGGMS